MYEQKYTVRYIKFIEKESWDLFRLMDCEKINGKYTFLLYFSMIYPKINFIFREMGNEKIMTIYSYLFPMCLLRKAMLFFPILQYYISIH